MAVAFVWEFPVSEGETQTRNYDAIAADVGGFAPEGMIVHTAGFDPDRGVFRIFDVWESREAGDRFMNDVLMPIVERVTTEADPETLVDPTAETWYELHDLLR